MNTYGQQAHEIDYRIFGEEMQCVEIELDPGETAVAEPGAFVSGRWHPGGHFRPADARHHAHPAARPDDARCRGDSERAT